MEPHPVATLKLTAATRMIAFFGIATKFGLKYAGTN
jgi:hypothetical protein